MLELQLMTLMLSILSHTHTHTSSKNVKRKHTSDRTATHWHQKPNPWTWLSATQVTPMNGSKSHWGGVVSMFPQRLTTLELLPKPRPQGSSGHWSQLSSTSQPSQSFSSSPLDVRFHSCAFGEQILKEKRGLNGVPSLIWWAAEPLALGPQRSLSASETRERDWKSGYFAQWPLLPSLRLTASFQ